MTSLFVSAPRYRFKTFTSHAPRFDDLTVIQLFKLESACLFFLLLKSWFFYLPERSIEALKFRRRMLYSKNFKATLRVAH